jgi:hypothetical protein
MSTTAKGKPPDWWDADEETFMRRMTTPEEDCHLYTAAPWKGGFRWFRSENVVCLEKYRRLRKERLKSTVVG